VPLSAFISLELDGESGARGLIPPIGARIIEYMGGLHSYEAAVGARERKGLAIPVDRISPGHVLE
jgi:hypothetical protein